jgi:lysylphosphatidylglycerol synthetase-like protein (DUF2156 family)
MTETIAAPESALSAVSSYHQADNPSAFLALNEGNSYFSVDGQPGYIAYRVAGDYAVQFGGPFAPAQDYAGLLREFREFGRRNQLKMVSIQLQRADAEIYAEQGLTVNQVGASYAVSLQDFSLRGTRFMQLRNKISRSFRAGLTVRESAVDEWSGAMRAIDASWLGGKGDHARQLEFLVGQYGGEMQRHRRLFVGVLDGQLAGYISYSPVYGTRAGWMHDLSRRRPGDLPGVMEAINKTAIDTFQSEQVRWLHFGFTPFTSLDDALELPGHSAGFQQFMHLLWEHGEAVYPARTQLAYKDKWAPDLVIPEYVAFDGRASVVAFAHIFRACNAF